MAFVVGVASGVVAAWLYETISALLDDTEEMQRMFINACMDSGGSPRWVEHHVSIDGLEATERWLECGYEEDR